MEGLLATMKELMNPRLCALLEQSIEDYIKTAVPIASGALHAKIENAKSSATIRNDLKILEEMGYLRQIHTSGGRVPTTDGYKFYVNRVMGNLNIRPGEMSFAADQISTRVGELPSIIDDICKKLESTVDYPIVVRQQFDKLIVSDIAIVPLLQGSTLVLIKTNAGSLSQAVAVENLNEKQCMDASQALNTRCRGLTLRAMLENLPKLTKELKKDLVFFESLCKSLGEKLEAVIQNEVKTHVNITKLLDMPNVKQVGRVIEDNDTLQEVLSLHENVVIGEDAAIIKFDYQIGGETIANIGIIGPERMDYKNLIIALYSLMSTVTDNRKLEGGKNEQKRIGPKE